MKMLWPNERTAALCHLLVKLGINSGTRILLSSRAAILIDGKSISCLMSG